MSSAVTAHSRLEYHETIAAIHAAITAGGGTIFASIDQTKAAEDVGLTLRPTTLILFGNPKGGTPLMAAFPMVALELPLKILVWQSETGVNVSYVPIAQIAERYGVTGLESLLANLAAAQSALAAHVT